MTSRLARIACLAHTLTTGHRAIVWGNPVFGYDLIVCRDCDEEFYRRRPL